VTRLVLAAVVALGLCGFAPTAATVGDPETADIDGDYAGDGVDIQGQKYQTSVKVQKDKDAHLFRWTTGGQEFLGVGIRTGKLVSVSWVGRQPGGVIVGVTVFEVRKDGSLSGRWTMLGAKGVVRTEVLTPTA
jgi:hypothetical protein